MEIDNKYFSHKKKIIANEMGTLPVNHATVSQKTSSDRFSSRVVFVFRFGFPTKFEQSSQPERPAPPSVRLPHRRLPVCVASVPNNGFPSP